MLYFGDRNVFSQSEQQELISQYSEEDRNKLFILKPLYQRAIIVAAGPLANFLLAILIFTLINFFVGKDMTPAIIESVEINTPAFESGFKKNNNFKLRLWMWVTNPAKTDKKSDSKLIEKKNHIKNKRSACFLKIFKN